MKEVLEGELERPRLLSQDRACALRGAAAPPMPKLPTLLLLPWRWTLLLLLLLLSPMLPNLPPLLVPVGGGE